MDYETKAAAPEIKDAFDDFLRAFEQFKEGNDRRLAEIERHSADVVTEEKVARIDQALGEQKRALDRLVLDAARPALSVERKAAGDRDVLERKQAFDRYVRKGDTAALDALELKSAFSAGSNADGGYTVPLEIETAIGSVLIKASPIRALSTVRQIGGSTYRKPVATNGPATGWVAETASRPQTDTPTLAVVDYPTMELYAMPAATSHLLDDSAVDIEQWLASEVQLVFAQQEGAAFISGNGTTQPKGFLSETIVADASWAWTKLGYIASGADGAFAASSPTDALVSLVYAPKQAYRANGTWVMNRKTESAIRKFKDTTGNYIWQPGVTAGQPPTLLGYPVAEAEDMPDIASASYSVAFGDFASGYLIVDRIGIRILRDPYSAKPYVLFYTTKRVGGAVQNYEAIKLMKFSVS
jgi:HK97 family phage major capsid protein